MARREESACYDVRAAAGRAQNGARLDERAEGQVGRGLRGGAPPVAGRSPSPQFIDYSSMPGLGEESCAARVLARGVWAWYRGLEGQEVEKRDHSRCTEAMHKERSRNEAEYLRFH